MADFIVLNSIFRDREQYPNPANFVVGSEQMKDWLPQPRAVRAFPSEVSNRPLLFVNTLKILHLVLPYQADLQDLGLVYVNVFSQKFDDKNLVYMMEASMPQIKFVCEWDKTQNDSAGDPAWIHYKTNMSQVMRFAKNTPVTFQIYKPDGSIVSINDNLPPTPADPTKQVFATIEVVPYQRDDEFSHHNVEYLTG